MFSRVSCSCGVCLMGFDTEQRCTCRSVSHIKHPSFTCYITEWGQLISCLSCRPAALHHDEEEILLFLFWPFSSPLSLKLQLRSDYTSDLSCPIVSQLWVCPIVSQLATSPQRSFSSRCSQSDWSFTTVQTDPRSWTPANQSRSQKPWRAVFWRWWEMLQVWLVQRKSSETWTERSTANLHRTQLEPQWVTNY